jgi:hypothetical protein
MKTVSENTVTVMNWVSRITTGIWRRLVLSTVWMDMGKNVANCYDQMTGKGHAVHRGQIFFTMWGILVSK